MILKNGSRRQIPKSSSDEEGSERTTVQYILMKDVVTVIIAEIFKTQENNG